MPTKDQYHAIDADSGKEIGSEIDRTIENLSQFIVDKHGVFRRRRCRESVHMGRELCDLFERVMGRVMTVDDITPETYAELSRHFPGSDSAMKAAFRAKWFTQKNQVAASLGWAKEQVFTYTPAPQKDIAAPEECESGDDISLQRLLVDLYIPRRLTGKSFRTRKLYANSIKVFGRWLGHTARLSDLNDSTVASFLQYLLDGTDLSRHTVEKHRVQIGALWNFAAKHRMVDTLPDIQPIPCPDRVPDSWSSEELARIMQACKQAPGLVGLVPAKQFWPALISFVLDSAERISAVLSTRHADLTGEWVTVRGEYRKGGKRDARYKLRPETVELLKAIEIEGQEHIFHWAYSENYLYYQFGRILEAAGLPSNSRCKFHKLRRTVASMYAAAGCDATRLLGHSRTSITEKSYLDPSVVKVQQPADILPSVAQVVTTPQPAKMATEERKAGHEKLIDEFREFLRQKGASS